jgi:hypothetical protein
MAVEYDLEMATPMPAAQVADELLDAARTNAVFDAPVGPEELLADGALTRLGTWVKVYEPNPSPWDAVTSDLGFTATVSIGFRFNKFTAMPEQDDDMVRLVSNLLDHVPGDAVLHFQLEKIWLLRRNGELSVSEDPHAWPQHRLAFLSQPYRRATHKFSGT